MRYFRALAAALTIAVAALAAPATSSAKVFHLNAEQIAQLIDKAEEGNRIQINRTALHALVPEPGKANVLSSGRVTAVIRNNPAKGVSLTVFLAPKDPAFVPPLERDASELREDGETIHRHVDRRTQRMRQARHDLLGGELQGHDAIST